MTLSRLVKILAHILRQKEWLEEKLGESILVSDQYLNEQREAYYSLLFEEREYRLCMQDILAILEQAGGFHLIKGEEAFFGDELLAPLKELKKDAVSTKQEMKAQLTWQQRETICKQVKDLRLEQKQERKRLEEKAGKLPNYASHRLLHSTDGCEISYYIFGENQVETLVLVNASGIPHEIFRYLIASYMEQYRVIVYDLRGTRDEDYGFELTLKKQGEDLALLLIKENIESAHFLCWCSGLKSFEKFYESHEDQVKDLVIISGYFNPLGKNQAYWTEFDSTIGRLSSMIVKNEQFSQSTWVLGLIQRLFNFNLESVQENKELEASLRYEAILKNATDEVKEIITYPFKSLKRLYNYAVVTLQLQSMDFSEVLEKLSCPTLILNAGMDKVTDLRCAKKQQAIIPTSSYKELPYSSHWCIYEDYEEIVDCIEEFYTEQIGSEHS